MLSAACRRDHAATGEGSIDATRLGGDNPFVEHQPGSKNFA